MSQQNALQRLVWLAGGISLASLGLPALALNTALGEAGINVQTLQQAPYNLTGRNVAIGQVEIDRPSKPGLDKSVSMAQALSLAQVFFRNTFAISDTNIDPHAAYVARIMVSQYAESQGVAPGAQLYASAVGTPQGNGQPEACLSAQHVALQAQGEVRTINFSFGESLQHDPRPRAVLDGNALLTQCIDWSTRVHNVLYVVAGNQGKGGVPIPTDNFNGINVAFTRQVAGSFSEIDPENLSSQGRGGTHAKDGIESNVGPRRSVNLVAPGHRLKLTHPNGRIARVSGTSFAAPQVTAAVAILQEFAETAIQRSRQTSFREAIHQRLFNIRQPRWGADARRPEVMKAVLLNSANKVQDSGDGLMLQMRQTIWDKQKLNWLTSDAYRDRMIPLHAEMGTGQLDVFRAYQQFSVGQWSSGATVPPVGWDYQTVAAPEPLATTPADRSDFRDYMIAQPLQKGSFAAITLTWNRQVDLQDANSNDQYDMGEAFQGQGLNNLDLYLMRAEDDDIADSVWSSVSEVDSVEHIFHRISQTGRYKIRVKFDQRLHTATQPYALAWWTLPAR